MPRTHPQAEAPLKRRDLWAVPFGEKPAAALRNKSIFAKKSTETACSQNGGEVTKVYKGGISSRQNGELVDSVDEA